MAMNTLDPHHRPDYTNTEPPFLIGPNESWFDKNKIVSLDPWGHLVQQEFAKVGSRGISVSMTLSLMQNASHHSQENASGLDIRPTISLTKAHIKMSELDASYTSGSLIPDGKVVHNSLRREGTTADPGVEVNTHKAAVEPVWYLPGLASRFGISEDLLRRCLFEGEPRVRADDFELHKLTSSRFRNRRNVPRTRHPTRPQSLPPPHRRSHRLHLWQPRPPLRPEQRAHFTSPRRM